MLPANKKREVNVSSRVKIWIYGAPFSGKTTLANQFPDALFLNTDGNLNSFDSPVVEIKEKVDGRQIIDVWSLFNDTVNELQKGSEFKTIVVDLVEDVYEACRRHCYKQLNIEHESDNGFKAWDYVRNEFLTTMKRLMTLDYNIVLISHEDMSKDITKKSGDKITSIRPNITEKIANKIAGMVDLVGRVVADDNRRTMSFKPDEVVFGGGRLKVPNAPIPLNYQALMQIYASQGVVVAKPATEPKVEEPEVKETEVVQEIATTEEETIEVPEVVTKRSRRIRQ